jgi:hypothetical protein
MRGVGDVKYVFSARLEQVPGGGPFFVMIPARVSKAIGRRGIVPIVAIVNDAAEVRASITPCGGGRHRLRLNAATRASAGARVGRAVSFELRVDAMPVADRMPDDLRAALEEQGALDAFERMPVGKRNHIIQWIEKSSRETTRAKRVGMAVEVGERARERDVDRAKPPRR